jgi:hypothetical protein
MAMYRRHRKTVTRTIVLSYDVYTDQYDDSYSDDDIMRDEQQRRPWQVFQQDSYSILSDTLEFRE